MREGLPVPVYVPMSLCLSRVLFFLYSFVSIFASRFSVTLCLSNLCLYHISTLPRSPPLPSSSSFCILAVFRGILLSTFPLVIGKESRVTLPWLLPSRFVVVREATEALKTTLYRTTSYCVLSPAAGMLLE